jgi:nucleoside-diphosphate-sugar epimerase
MLTRFNPMTSKLIFGCGFLGGQVARLWRGQGHTVHAVTRSASRADIFAREGLAPIVADITQPSSLRHLPTAETVLFAVGFDRQCGKTIEQVYVTGLTNVLSALPYSPRRFIYISTTGVYGQTGGEWVDESALCKPERAGGKACLLAEQKLAASRCSASAIVLRCAGLYGPGRIPLVDEVRLGNELPSRPEAHINLIHVEDATRVVAKVEEVETASRLFNVSDGHPVVRREFYDEIARLIGAPQPRFAQPQPDSMDRRQRTDDKMISNQRLLRELGIDFRYPNFRAGLAAIFGDHPLAS